MFYILISLLLGMIPDVLYFMLFIIYAKNIKEHKLKLFIMLVIGYILLIMICRYQYIFYIAFVLYIYLIIKWLYKSQINDLFIIILAFMYLTIISYIFYVLIHDYTIYYIVDRILLFLPLIVFKNKIKNVYLSYSKMWNRNDKNKIKSLTIRNSALFLMNTTILITFLVLLYILSII